MQSPSQVEPLLEVILNLPHKSQSVSSLLDSGAAGNFISADIVARLQIPTIKLDRPISITAVDGS